MALNVKVENFEGPFDLLLHLIRKNKMDIYDIKIYEITNQYLYYINSMEEMDLEFTSEFIVIASTLIEIKSKMLLPKHEEVEEESEKDPRKELISKLLEYKKFKAAAQELKERELNIGVMYSKKPEIIETKKEKAELEEILKKVNMLQLYDIFNNLLNNYKKRMNTSNIIDKDILIDKYKIEDKMEFIKEEINSKDKIIFSSILKKCKVKIEAIVTFLALLELMKLRVVRATQEDNYKEIYIERIEQNG